MRVTARPQGGTGLSDHSLKRPPPPEAVDKTLLLHNADIDAFAAKGASYDASGKGGAAVQMTTAAEATWSRQNPRGLTEARAAYRVRRIAATQPKHQASSKGKRTVTMDPEESRKSGNGKGSKGGRSKGSGGKKR